MRAADLAEAAGVTSAVVKSLVKDGALETVALPPFRKFEPPDLNANGYDLSPQQKEAAKQLRALVTARTHKVALLDGVTGSGKTEVYFEAMAASTRGGPSGSAAPA